MQKYTPTENISIESMKREASSRILVTGASGFIGSRVISRLLRSNLSSLSPKENYEIVCLTRDKKSLRGLYDGHEEAIRIVEADVNDYPQLVKALKGVTTAFYLIHSMEGSSKEWKKFAQRDRSAAKNFANAASECGVERIIYLGGLTHGGDREYSNELSEHMRSRKEVGDILRTSKARVTFFHAAVILGLRGRLLPDAGIFGEKIASNGMPKMGLD
jgi:uncharacterized protein YbjT (DUF2867 family)